MNKETPKYVPAHKAIRSRIWRESRDMSRRTKRRSKARMKAPYKPEPPQPKDPYGDSLLKCNTVKQVRRWLSRTYGRLNKKALKAIERRVLDDKMRSDIHQLLLGPSGTSVFQMNNGKLAKEARKRLHIRLVDIVAGSPMTEFALVTFISGDGGTSLNRPRIELFQSQKRVQSTLRAMADNHFGITELALFNSHTHPDGGAHIQRHEHALIWGPSGTIARAQRVRSKQSPNYPANFTGARVIDVRPLESTESVNLARMAAYLMKAPSMAMNWCPPRDGKPGHMNKSEKGDRYIRFLRMVQLRTMLTFEDVAFAGGQGQAIKSALIKLLRPQAHEDAPPNLRLLHPDEIASFWVEIAKALQLEHWALPVIIRSQ